MNRESILGVDDRKIESVNVPEWSTTIRIRTISGADRDAFDREITDADGNVNYTNFRAKLLVRCIVDEQGNRIFRDEDAEQLGAKSAAAIGRLFEVAQRINGIGSAAAETMEKN